MSARKPFATGLGCFSVAFVAWALLLLPATDAGAITFGRWALGRWPYNTPPATVEAKYCNIDSLDGMGNYDWMATPTTTLYLGGNPITSIESGDFIGLGALTTLDFRASKITSLESGDLAGLGSLLQLTFEYNKITSIEIGHLQRAGLFGVSGIGLLTKSRALNPETLPGWAVSRNCVCGITQSRVSNRAISPAWAT